jgi:Secretion system C-terminal sorting domain
MLKSITQQTIISFCRITGLKLLTFFFFSFLLSNVYAQITITTNEMPSAGDTARITNATVNPFINYGATGANYTWNFANLRNNGQALRSYQSVSSTNLIYSLFFLNLPFNPNRANVVEAGTPIPANPLLTITDPYNFYYSSSSVYKQVGFGAEIASFPTPVAYSQHDVIYNLPLNYADADTSESAWNIGLPGLGYYGFNQTRINDVDGWGILTTPHDTFDVVRVKTELYASDTIGVDSLGLNFALDRPKTTQYKWLANNEIVPVMQITTTEILGLEVVTEIFYRDDYNTITPGVLNSAYCAGSTITIPYTAMGSYNGAALFQAANVFTAELSDDTGSFANAVAIGTFTSRFSGSITVTIPASTPAGNGYRIRIVSSSPAVTGGDNGFDIRIENLALATISTTSATTFCAGDSALLQSTSIALGFAYQWQLNGADIAGATDSIYVANAAGTYSLNTSNSCGTVASGTIIITIIPLPDTALTASGPVNFCLSDSVTLSAVANIGNSYQWQLNGVDITGAILPDLVVVNGGSYSVNISNACGTVSSSSIAINITATAVAGTISSAGSSFCQGDSLQLSAQLNAGYTYQWQLNGADINGASGDSYYALAAGNYNVVVSNNCGIDTSLAVTITQNALPVAIASAGGATTFCAGGSLVLNASTGTGYTYQWQLNGADIIGETLSSLLVNSSGNYSVNVSNVCGTITSNIIAAVVNPLPAVPQISLQTDSLLSTVATTYQWYFNGVLIPGATNSYYIPTQNGDYTVAITDSNGCANTSAIFNMTSVGINNMSVNAVMGLYPNPVKNVLNLQLNADKPEKMKLEIYSASAALLRQSYVVSTVTASMDVSDLSAGLYFVKLTGEDSKIIIARFIKE